MLQAFREGMATSIHPFQVTASLALRPDFSSHVDDGTSSSFKPRGQRHRVCKSRFLLLHSFSPFACFRYAKPTTRNGAWVVAPLHRPLVLANRQNSARVAPGVECGADLLTDEGES